MKKIIFILLTTFLANAAHTANHEVPFSRPKQFVVIAVSGLKTGRDSGEELNIISNKIGKSMEPSGAWENLPTHHKKILKNAYLTHFSTEDEIQSALRLLLDSEGSCLEDTGLILMVNSWGAITSQKLAAAYNKKCQKIPLLTVLIEGVSKPTPFAYKKSILAHNCINFYQTKSSLKGGPIANCKNHEFEYASSAKSLFNTHIHAEWDGSQKAKQIIEQYMDGKLPLYFVRDLYNVDTEAGL